MARKKPPAGPSAEYIAAWANFKAGKPGHMLSLLAKRRQAINNRSVYETLDIMKALAPEEMKAVEARIASYRPEEQGVQQQIEGVQQQIEGTPPPEVQEPPPPPPTPIRGTITKKQRDGIRAMCDSKGWEIPEDLDAWSQKRASDWMEQHDFRGWKRAHPRDDREAG